MELSPKNESAVALGKKRWEGKSSAEKSDFAKSGVNARWASKTPEERLAHGKKLAEARAKARAKKAGGQ